MASSEVVPITGAPREPRIGSVSPVVEAFHKGKFGSRSMVGTVSDAGRALPVPVPVAEPVVVAADDDVTGAIVDDDGTGELEEDTEELVVSEGPAGAEDERVARSRAQRQVERRSIS